MHSRLLQTLWTDFSKERPSAANGGMLEHAVTPSLMVQGIMCRGLVIAQDPVGHGDSSAQFAGVHNHRQLCCPWQVLHVSIEAARTIEVISGFSRSIS